VHYNTCNTLNVQHTATHCNALQHTATRTVTRCRDGWALRRTVGVGCSCGQAALWYHTHVKRDVYKSKEPYHILTKIDPQKRPTKEPSTWATQCRRVRAGACGQTALWYHTYVKRDVYKPKETYQRDLQKRPTKETCQRALYMSNAMTPMFKKTCMNQKRPATIKRNLQQSKETY